MPSKTEKATIHYNDIGDYFSREEKLIIIKKFHSITNPQMTWELLEPNQHGDWINKRNDFYSTLIPMAPEKKFDVKSQSFFNTYLSRENDLM